VLERGGAGRAAATGHVIYFPAEVLAHRLSDAGARGQALQGTLPLLLATRGTILTAARQSLEALKENIIDGLGGLEDVLAFIEELRLTSKPDKGVVGELKREMWRETVDYLENDEREAERAGKASERLDAEAAAREKRVELWSTKPKAKL
jgi:hypothetical protein